MTRLRLVLASAAGSAAADFGDQGHLAYRRTIYRRTDRLTDGGKRIRTLGPRYVDGVCETVLGVWCAYAFRPERPTRSQGDRRVESAFLWHRMSERPCSLGNLMPWRRLHVNPRDPLRPCRNVDENDFWFTPVPLQRAPQPRGRAKLVRVRARRRAAAPARAATLRGGHELP